MCTKISIHLQRKKSILNKFNNSKYENLQTQKQVIINAQYNVDLEKLNRFNK